jgi:hypothetical protein
VVLWAITSSAEVRGGTGALLLVSERRPPARASGGLTSTLSSATSTATRAATRRSNANCVGCAQLWSATPRIASRLTLASRRAPGLWPIGEHVVELYAIVASDDAELRLHAWYQVLQEAGLHSCRYLARPERVAGHFLKSLGPVRARAGAGGNMATIICHAHETDGPQ